MGLYPREEQKGRKERELKKNYRVSKLVLAKYFFDFFQMYFSHIKNRIHINHPLQAAPKTANIT